MLSYNLHLAWRSLRKTPVMSLLMVSAIGVGIGVCMTIITIYTLMTNDPIPAKSDRMFTYALDNHLEIETGQELDDPAAFAGYRDVMNLRGSSLVENESIHYQSSAIFRPHSEDLKPFRDVLRLATNGFFPMFDVPFQYGGPWSNEAEAGQEYVIVLTKAINDRLFGGVDSVGKSLDVDGRFYQVVGVMDEFSPIPRYFEVDGGVFEDTDGAFIPFSLTPILELSKTGGSTNCISDVAGPGFQGFLDAECTWIHHWILLNSPSDEDAFYNYLNNYTQGQREYGRFQGPYRNRLFTVEEFLEFRDVMNPAYVMLIGIAFMFLVVCLLNMSGLLVAKFAGRAGEISVRRALGCSKWQTFAQHLVEVGLIGLAGGLLGLALAGAGLVALKGMFANYENLAHLNSELVVMAVALSIGATLVAGLYPAWRICQVPPATYLKSQ